MNATRENKYKECTPTETVERIKGILKDIGIVLEEQWIDTGVEGFYALRVNVPGTLLLGSNGKGATREYAQASAYAEFMERLQNDYLGLGDFDEDTWKYKGFYHTPDERILSPAELADNGNAFTDMLIKLAEQKAGSLPKVPLNKADLMAVWQYPVFRECSDKFVAVRYYSVKNKRYEYVPHSICMKIYHSNGMCAGNTPEEALVQGVSEVFERNVNCRMVKERLKLPDIPQQYLMKYDRLYKAIKEIEADGRYRVLVKDGSLGKGYPVVVLVIIDNKRQTYGVRLGAHPEFEIALERTLSEAFQGKNIETFTGLSFLRFDDAGIQSVDNVMNIAKIGLGQYPLELFSENAAYEFVPFKDVTGKSNGEILKDMLDIILSQGYDILIKDVSYLGFPAYHIIVPGFSEVYDPDPACVQETLSAKAARNAMRNLHTASPLELMELIRYLNLKQNSLIENTVPALAGVEFRRKFPGGAYEHFFLMGACLHKLGNFRDAAACFGMVANGMMGTSEEVYYRGIAHYASAVAENKTQKEISAIFRLFYPPDISQKVCEQMENSKAVLEKLYPKMGCFECTGCAALDNCSYSIKRRIKRAFKEKQAEAGLESLEKLEI